VRTPPRVLYRVPKQISACTYYRAEVPARILRRLGAEVDLGSPVEDARTMEELEQVLLKLLNYDALYYYSTGGEAVEKILEFIDTVGCEETDAGIITPPSFFEDLDDNADHVSPFNPRFCALGTRLPGHGPLIPGESVNIVTEKGEKVTLWEDKVTTQEGLVFDIERNQRGMESLYRVLRKARGVSFTTARLRDYYVENHGLENTYVFPNSVIFEDYPDIRLRKEKGVVRVMWQGGDSHYEDWYGLKGALAEVVEKMPEVRFVIWGMKFPWVHDVIPKDRIEFHEWVPYEAYKIKLSALDFDIAVAPLVENDFNVGKSCIKWYEVSALPEPRPFLASAVPPYSDEIVDGETGMLFSTPTEFVEKLGQLVSSKRLRGRLAANAKEWVREHRDAERTVPPYWEWIRASHAGFQERAREAHLRLVPPPVQGA